MNDFGEALITYWDAIHPNPVFGIDQSANVTQYCDVLKIDFTLGPIEILLQHLAAPTLPAELDAGYRVLLDKDHLTDTLRTPTGKVYVPTPRWFLWINNCLDVCLVDKVCAISIGDGP